MATHEIAFGTGGLRSREAFRDAWDAGFRVFDTGVYYTNDDALLAALEERGAGDEARIIHKVQPYRVSDQFERLIRPKLRGRVLDTLLLHHPALFVLDASPSAVMKPWSELEALVEAGLVRRIGLSNAGAAFLDHLWEHAAVKPQVNQIEVHPRQYDSELIGACLARGIEVQCFSPLGGGRVPVLENAIIREIARAVGRSEAQVCLRWLIQKGLVPIVRTSSPERMRDDLSAATFTLDASQMSAIDRIGSAERAWAWDDPIKRGSFSARISAERITVPNRVRFAMRSAFHYALVELFLRRRAAR